MWFYVRCVLLPHQRTDDALHGRPRGNLSDLYPRWLGSRELLLHYRDPYSAEITREIQVGYYGRPLEITRPNDQRDEERFAYPVYVAFLLAPAIVFPFAMIQVAFRWLLFIVTATTVPLWLRAIGFRASLFTMAILITLTVGCFPAVQGIELQQLSLLVNGLAAVSLVLLAGGHLWLAGTLIAVATIKPQLVLPLIAWLMLWAFSNWRTRRGLVLGFGLMMAILALSGELILPGWIGRFMDAIAAYWRYTDTRSVLDLLAGRFAGRILAGTVVVVVANRCWRFRHSSANDISFALACSLALTATIVIVPTFAPYNQLLLLPAIFLFIGYRRLLPSMNPVSRILGILVGMTIFWPWAATVGLTIVSFVLSASRVQQAWPLPFYTSSTAPLTVLGLLVQYAFQIVPPNDRLGPTFGQVSSRDVPSGMPTTWLDQ